MTGESRCPSRQVDADPRIVVEGHEAELDEVAAHAELPYQFATACKSGKVVCRPLQGAVANPVGRIPIRSYFETQSHFTCKPVSLNMFPASACVGPPFHAPLSAACGTPGCVMWS